jgi:hypothetical protein
LDAVAKVHGATFAQLSIAWLLHHSPVILPIAGTSSVAHLEENLKAAEISLSDAELKDLGDKRSNALIVVPWGIHPIRLPDSAQDPAKRCHQEGIVFMGASSLSAYTKRSLAIKM